MSAKLSPREKQRARSQIPHRQRRWQKRKAKREHAEFCKRWDKAFFKVFDSHVKRMAKFMGEGGDSPIYLALKARYEK